MSSPESLYGVKARAQYSASWIGDLFASREDFIAQTYGYSGLLGLGDVYAERYWMKCG